MKKQLVVELNLDSDEADREQAIKDAMQDGAEQFAPLLEREMDHSDARTELLPGIYVSDVSFDDESESTGTATIEFESEQYSGCKDMRGNDEHDVDVPFRIEGDKLKFVIDLRPSWNPSERGD